jgi:hypothetical protein
MTKKKFLPYFRQISQGIPKNDKPMLRQVWNDTIDLLCKDGFLKDRARNWSHPKKIA